jgi:hypothetical protein
MDVDEPQGFLERRATRGIRPRAVHPRGGAGRVGGGPGVAGRRRGRRPPDRRGARHRPAPRRGGPGRADRDLALTFSGDYSHQAPDCCAQVHARVGATQRPLSRQYAALSSAFGYAPPSTNAFDRRTDLDATLRAGQELGGASLRAEWNLGEAR